MRMTLSRFEQLYQEYQESGLNVKDFCANQAFAPSSFYYWRKKLQATEQREPSGNFIPLVVGSEQVTTHSIGKHPNKTNHTIEIIFPNGTKVRVGDNVSMQFLKRIIHLFD